LRTRTGGLAAAIALFTILSLAYFGGALTDPAHRCACSAGTDPETYMWFLSWWPHAILHGHNPFHTTSLFAPDWIRLGAVLVIPGAATVLTPITLLFGPVVAYNLLIVAAPVLAAVFTFMLCRYLTGRLLPSLVGGYIFGFSPYLLGHMQGHADLVLVFPIPAIVHVCLRCLDHRITRRRAVVYLVILLTTLYLCSPEMTLTFVLAGAVVLAAGFSLAVERRRDVIEVARTVVLAGACAVVLVSVFLYYALTGDITEGFFNGFDDYGANGLGWLVPTNVAALAGSWFQGTANTFKADVAEHGVYVGIPLALVVVHYLVTRRRLASTRVLLVVLAILLVLASGAHLYIGGTRVMPLPWDALSHLPLLRRAIALRLAAYVFLIVAVVVALWLAQPGSDLRRAVKWVVAAAGLALLVPNLGEGFWSTRPTNPRFFTTQMYRHYLTRDETVLLLPWGQTGYGMLWQAETGFWFRQAGAYVGALLPVDYVKDPLLAPFHGSTVPPTVDELRGFLRYRSVGAVVIQQSMPGYWSRLLTGIGLHGTAVGGVVVYPVTHGRPIPG
jgi:hypothetical protein